MIYKNAILAKSIIIFFSLLPSIAFSKGNNSNNTIPFASYELILLEEPTNVTSASRSEIRRYYVPKRKVIEVPTDEIAEAIKKIKSETCSIIAPGTVEIWMGIGADAKAVIVTSHVESGMKITFSCDEQKIKR